MTHFLLLLASVLSLNGDWTLGYRPEQEGGDWKSVPATVPGDTFAALQQAGVLPDLQVGTNIFAALPFEAYEWRYTKTFTLAEKDLGGAWTLRFAGVDTFADYFLNGRRIGASANMFVPASFDVSGLLKRENELEVRLRSPLGPSPLGRGLFGRGLIGRGQFGGGLLGVLGRTRVGGTDVEGVRKAQHAFGWDIMPRLVSSGLWRGVTLERVPDCRFADLNFICTRADPKGRTADVRVDCFIQAPWKHLHRSRLRLILKRNGRERIRREATVHFYQTRDMFTIREADLWWPRDAGEAALYDLTAEFLDEAGRTLARAERKVGLRTVRLERADWHSENDPGTFRFIINGEPIYMHGCDVTPMDAMHAKDETHRVRCQEMLVDLNCNMVRVWGGGVYESDAFYDFCDRNGICVWQDFMLGNVEPRQDDAFAALMAAEARHQVVRLRSHPSLALWCGNNEIDRSVGGNWGALAPDPEGERISRETFPRVLREFDPLTPYLPSSPWWTPEVVAGRARLSQDHLWGPRHEYYKGAFWCRSSATFVSETGYHGCPNLASLQRMMTPQGLYPWPDAKDLFHFNAEWDAKAVSAYPDQRGMASSRNSLMPKQVRNMFGSCPTNLAAFVEQSQTVQAEALKYWMELSRSRKGRTWGMLWWNLRDGWPIISDSVVDYYYGRKKAYSYLKAVQQPQLVACVEEGRLVAVNDRLYLVKGRVVARDCETGRTLYSGEVEVGRNATKILAERLPLAGKGMVRLVYAFEGVSRTNHCLYGAPPFDYAAYRRWRGEGEKMKGSER